jgi:hypothetical protein
MNSAGSSLLVLRRDLGAAAFGGGSAACVHDFTGL